MRFNIFASGLAIALGLAGVRTIGFPEMAVAQQQTSEIDTAISEGLRLLKEGSAESLKKAIGYFEKALRLTRSAKAQDKQALALLALGKIHDSLGEKQKAIDYYNQSLPIFRAVGDRSYEATTLNNLSGVYNSLGEKQKAIDYYNQALPIVRAVGNRSVEATTLNNLGFALDSQKQSELAIVVLKQSVNIYESLRQEIKKLPRET